MSKLRLICILAAFLVSLVAQPAATQAANHLPPTTMLFWAQQQDEEPKEGIARLGENRGALINKSEIWTYEGQAGNILTIKAEADNPANDADTEERSQAGLLDMMLIVYAPDGSILAKADDIQPGIVTDAVIEGLALPTAGTYKIEVLGLEKEGSGAYTLTLQAGNGTSAEPTPTLNPDWPILTVENQLEETICYVYIWPTSTDELGDEWLGTKKVISPNDEHQWHVAPDEYDIVLNDCYGNTLDKRRKFDVTNSSTLTVSPSTTDGSAAQCAEGVQLFLDGKVVEAFPLLEAGFAGRESATFANLDDEGICALALGKLHHGFGNRSAALQAYQVALDIFQASGNRELEGTTLNNIGVVYDSQGKYEEALEKYKQALEIVREVRDRAGEGATLNNIGAVYHAQGKYEEALKQYQQALEITREIRYRAGEGATLNNIGEVYFNQGQYKLALEQHQQALEIRREVRDRAGEGTTLNSIGGVYHAQGKYEEALEQFNQALEISREVRDRAGEGTTLNNIGGVYHSQGKYEEALEQHQQALEIFREVEDRADEGTTLNNIGGVYDSQAKYKEALEQFNQALEISREVGDRVGEAGTLNNIGSVYRAQGKYSDALEQYQQALEIVREMGERAGEGITLNNIGLVYHNQGKYKDALKQYKQALFIFGEVGYPEGPTLNNIGVVYRVQGKYEEALEQYQQALEIFREVGDRADEGITLSNIGWVYDNQGKYEEALVYYKQAMDVFESVRVTAGGDQERASFIAQYTSLYHRAINLYHQQGQEEDAFYTSERGRARSFLDSLATGEVQLSDEDLQELLTREGEAYAERESAQDVLIRARAQNPPDAELAELEADLEEAKEEYSQVQAEIDERGGKLKELIPGRSTVLDLPAVQELLDEQTTLVSYWLLGDEGTVAFIITQDSLAVVELPLATTENLTNTLTALYGWPNIQNPSPDTLLKLHEWLIAPLQEHLRTPQVGLIPHQLLHYVPFAALTDADGNRYFGEQHTLFVLPSASALEPLQETVAKTSQAKKQPALVFGDPTHEDMPPLRESAIEAREVAKWLGVQEYLRDKASEERLRSLANNAEVVHLSAHGVYSTTNPLDNSAIFLAGGDDKPSDSDGFFNAREVYELDLTATELVVLSACETTINDLSARDEVAVSAGDEVEGMTRAFLFAGTPTVVASLWPVDDESTKKLMLAFYRHWLEEGMSKGEALQAAQAEIREEYPSPYYWAGFVLSGDPGESTSTASPDQSGRWLGIVGATLLVGLLVGGWLISRRRRA